MEQVLPLQGPVRGGTEVTLIGNHLAGLGEQLPPTVRLGHGESSTVCTVVSMKERVRFVFVVFLCIVFGFFFSLFNVVFLSLIFFDF